MASAPTLPDVNEAGRTLATLNDWRAIVFVLLFVLVLFAVLIIWERISTGRREERLAAAVDKVGDALEAMTLEFRVMRALAPSTNAAVAATAKTPDSPHDKA